MRAPLLAALSAPLWALALLPAPAAAETSFVIPVPNGSLVRAPVQSWWDRRFSGLVRQAYDLSCGAAALATILRYYYQDEVTEQEIIERMLELGDLEKIKKDGFSLLELKRFAENKGYTSAGFRVPDVAKLTNLEVPAIAIVNVRGYAHFVVIKGLRQGHIYLADPAFGNRVRTLDAFADEWNHVILVVLSRTRSGDEGFIKHATVKARPGDLYPFLQRGFTSLAPGSGEF